MIKVNRDAYVAVFLLLFSGVFLAATFYVEDMGYDSMGSEVWPQLILGILFVLTPAYLFQSLRKGPDEALAQKDRTFKGWLHYYRNALWCYALFFVFLVTLPWLGMLLGGVLFVFSALTVLGNRTPRDHAIHAAIALGTMTGMWAIFTFGLKVFLPAGVILPAM